MRALALMILPLATPAVAGGISLSLPIDCSMETTCYIQHLVDTDPGPGVTDFQCGSLSYDGHTGVDFALPSLAMLDEQVPVVAAQAGVVKAIRDGMPDIINGSPGAPDISGRECGNAVVIAHRDGWETQYCHMKRGSIAVSEGQSVQEGDRLGAVGLSGNTQFPHLHFMIRKDGVVVDPFAPEQATCGSETQSLFRTPPPTPEGGLISADFYSRVPEFDEVKQGIEMDTAAPDNPLVLWGYMFAPRKGDVIRISFDGPQGIHFEHDALVQRDQAVAFRAAGKNPPDNGWPEGAYDGTVQLIRDGAILDEVPTWVYVLNAP